MPGALPDNKYANGAPVLNGSEIGEPDPRGGTDVATETSVWGDAVHVVGMAPLTKDSVTAQRTGVADDVIDGVGDAPRDGDAVADVGADAAVDGDAGGLARL